MPINWESYKMIPYGRQDISEADINSVIDVLRSDFLMQGPKVPDLILTSTWMGSLNHELKLASEVSL